MKRNFKSVILLLAAIAASGVAGAQNTRTMDNNSQRVADTVKNGFQKIEDGVVSGYKAIENGVVKGYTAIQDGVVEAKARIAREEEELHRQNQDRVAASRHRAEEAGHKAKERAGVNNK